MFDDKICQSNMCSGKNCHGTKFMWPVKPAMDMQSSEPAIQLQSSFKKKHVPIYIDKNCQSTRCYRNKSPVRPRCSNDKNCQSTRCFSFKKKCPVRPVCDDNNCQSANLM